MNKTDYRTILYVTMAFVLAGAWGGPVWAQQSTPAAAQTHQNEALQEIIVTARKREESLLNVPVIETAVPKPYLENMQITDMSDLEKIVPGLNMAHGLGSVGEQVSIRGVGTIATDPGLDSSVSLNIDGLDLGSSLALQSGLFDLQQVEVLKGPQALFYGKASPGGVISLRTADPTDRFDVIGRVSYEFESITPREEAIISGPVTDTLKLRLASMYSHGEGYFHETAIATPGTGALSPIDNREPDTKQYMIRGTALWSPTSQFDARLKADITNWRGINAQTAELKDCPEGPGFAPSGIPFIGSSPCQISRDLKVVYMNPANFVGLPNNGQPFIEYDQNYGTLELNYRPIQDLTLASVTALYHVNEHQSVNATNSNAAGPAIAVYGQYHRTELTEEMRLNSEFQTPLNFTAGAFYEDGSIFNHPHLLGNTAYKLPAIFNDSEEDIDIKTYSLFGQLRWKIVRQLELAGGLRWTDEKRSIVAYNWITGTPVFVPLGVTSVKSDTAAPEITLTYKPTEDQTLFAAFKQADKSGGFGLGLVPTPGADLTFGQEKVRGGEVGMKSRLFDRRLALNVAAYYYHYDGLQVGSIKIVNGIAQTTVENAGAARTYGLDLDGVYRPEVIEGLGLNGAVNWNRARYLVLNGIPCWGGQTIAAGCNQDFNSKTGLYTAQNLSGTPMVRAPEWQMNVGFDYEFSVGGDYKMVVTNSNMFSSSYATFLAVGRPNNDTYQGSFAKVDLGLSLKAPDNRWELALIGKDINDRITTGLCSAANYANGAVLGGEITGGTGVGPAKIDQVGCNVDAGRQIWLRLSLRPFAGL